MAHLIGSVPRNYVEGNNQVFILISHSTASNIVFYSSLDLEVTILSHSSWLLSDLYFEISLLPSSPLQSPDFPEALAGRQFKPSPASPALPGCTGHPLLGEPVAPPCFLNSRLCYLAPLPDSFPRISHRFFNLTDLELNLSPFPPTLPCFVFC